MRLFSVTLILFSLMNFCIACSDKSDSKQTAEDETDSVSDGNTDGDTDTNGDSGTNADTNGDSGTNANSGTNTDSEGYRVTYTGGDTDAFVEEILGHLSLAQKAGQMVQGQFEDVSAASVRDLCIGSVFNGGEEPVRPNAPENWAVALDALQMGAMDGGGIPILYGIDAVHGNAKVIGSTVFPHGIGLGATRDAELVARVGQATGRECRGVGIHLTFAPSVSVARDERWGRTYEGFAETPELNAELGAAYVRGLQGMGDLSAPGAIAATVKHYVGDGGTTNGKNAGVNEFGEDTLRTIHLPPYETAVAEGVAAVMPSYHSWMRDGTSHSMTTDSYSLTDMLKGDLGFDGFCLSDYDAIPFAAEQIHAIYDDDNVAAAINAGMDMAMIAAPRGIDAFISAVQSGQIPESRIDDAVRRILKVKLRMNLFENSYSNPDLRAEIWSTEHQDLAREAVQKSLVLLSNDNSVLPLSKDEAVTVVGPFADMMGAQAGGWTVGWQGVASYDTDDVRGETILTGMQAVGSNVTFDSAAENIGAGKVVAVIGEKPYAEGHGDHGNTRTGASVYLRDCPDYDVLTKAMASDAQIVLVIISGRPMIIDEDVLSRVDAIVAAWLPGSRGIGVADALYGDVNFTGKLPHTWPATFDQIPINVNTQPDEPGLDADESTPLFQYGFGLAY